MLRTMRAAGRHVTNRPDIFVRRLPPTPRDFRRQRVRHAYESLAQPTRMAAELSLLPAFTWLVFTRKWKTIRITAVVIVGAAEAGRRWHGGRRVFPPTSALFAPAWLLERAVCSWVAAWLRSRGGLHYAGTTFRTAGHSVRFLRRARKDERPSG